MERKMKHWPSVGFLFFSFLLTLAEASHYRFGSLSFAPVDNQSNTLRFIFRLGFRRSSGSYYCNSSTISSGSLRGSGDSWRAQCVNYYGYSYQCNGRNIADTGFRCTDYSSVEDWTIGENNFTYNFPSIHDKWTVSYSSCCWIPLSGYYSFGSWFVSALVNLTRRADNGGINSSPVSRSPAIVRWQEGCPQFLRIPVEDPDGDVIKCRWATYSESYFRYPDSFPHGSLDERICLLSYNGSNGTAGTYGVALTLEDYPAGTADFNSLSPFSSVGLQFLVIISSQYGSCSDVPVFTAATPNDGECSEVQIGSAYRAAIEVKLADFSKHIAEIVTSSPPGMQLSSLRYSGGVYYRNVTWYPSQYQVGQQSFCFKAVDSTNMESEYRCVTILVGLSNTPRVVMGSQLPRNPVSKIGPGFIWWSIQFDRVIKKPRTSSYIRLVSLYNGHAVYKVDTLSSYVRISSDHTTLQFAMPNAALSMNGSYAILIDQGAVVGQGCSYDGPPTPGIISSSLWRFVVSGFCPFGSYLAPPGFTYCVDINECGYLSRSKRSYYYYGWGYTSSFSSTSLAQSLNNLGMSPTTSSSYMPFSALYPGYCSNHVYMYSYHYIESPGYPSCYQDNMDCTWLLEAPVGYASLDIYRFNLEYGGSNCPLDYLEIRDGNTASSPLITKACGSVSYMSIYATGRFLFLRFHSNGYTRMPGFYGYCYASSYKYSNWIPSQQLHMSSSAFCFSSQTHSTEISPTPSIMSTSSGTSSLDGSSSAIAPTLSSSQVPFSVLYPGSCSSHIYMYYYHYAYFIQSPSYPSCYPDNKDCTWLVEASSGYATLYIYQFNLEYGGSHCPSDYLEIRDGKTASSPLITKACGSVSYLQIYASGRFLFMRFHSNGYTRMPGFYGYCYASYYRYSNWIPSQQLLTSSSAFCVSFQTDSTDISPTQSIASTPYHSSSVQRTSSASAQVSPTRTNQYTPSSSYNLAIPSDFQLDMPSDCDQICRNTPGSYSCSCVTGYQLAPDGKSCTDINECSINNGGCSHHCYNIPGSFYCGCPEGTTMAANNLTCVEPGVSVTCGENNMTVSLEKQTFPFFTVNNLHLRYSSCRATQNSTHLIINTPLNGCGTQVNETQNDLIFWNEIQVDAVIIDFVVTRTHDVKIPFYCSYSRRDRITISFNPESVYFGVQSGYGNFTFRMKFYKSASFAIPYTDYPIQVALNDYVYVEYKVESAADLVIMAENCRATKGPSFYSWPQYNIIQNGCPSDTTLDYSYDPTRNYQRFKIRAFRFFNDYDTVYFHCEVLACHRYSPNSRCRNSCVSSRKRKRRDVTRDDLGQEESTTKEILTGGPLVVKKTETGDTGQSKHAALIGGVAGAGGFGLLAIIALAVLFVKYRIARRFMNRNKVGDLYTTQEEKMSRKHAYIQEDDMIEREDSF